VQIDKVPHRRLLQKLRAHGITGSIINWSKIGWLTENRVVINGICSRFTAVISGVPQGSIFGPLLFIIFINDLDDGVVNKILNFADDTKIVSKVASEDQIKILQSDLHKMFSRPRIGKCCSTRIKVKSCILVLITRLITY